VLNLHRAALENRKAELKGKVLGLSIAVINALDLAFGGGKGKILENWLKVVDSSDCSRERDHSQQCSSLSPRALAFFGGRPVVRKPQKD